jgi:hypothetical protein
VNGKRTYLYGKGGEGRNRKNYIIGDIFFNIIYISITYTLPVSSGNHSKQTRKKAAKNPAWSIRGWGFLPEVTFSPEGYVRAVSALPPA